MATSARVIVKKRFWWWPCDGVCVEYVNVFARRMYNNDKNINPIRRLYSKEFRVEEGTLQFKGCDDCSYIAKR